MGRDLGARKNGIGEPSSKYGYDRDGSQFIADMEAGRERYERLWTDFVEFMKSHDVKPSDFRRLFVRYYEEFIQEAL